MVVKNVNNANNEPKELLEHMSTSVIFEKDMMKTEGVDTSIMEKYLHLGHKRLRKKGECIHEIGRNIKGAYFIKKGRVKSYLIGKDGTLKTFFIVGENCFFSEQFVFHSQPSMFETVALKNCELYFFDKDTILNIMKKDFEVNLFIVKTLALKSRVLAAQIEDKCMRNILQNVCRILHSIYCYEEGNSSSKDDIQIQLTHQELADILSSHRVTVTKSLSYLKKLGVLDYKYENIIIKSKYKDKLKEIAFDISYD